MPTAKAIITIQSNSKEDELKYAYAFMKTNELHIKECSFLNPNPKQFNTGFLMPRDLYSATYNETVPSWSEFKINPAHYNSPSFACIASLDANDQERVNLASFNGTVYFNIYGTYEKEAQVIFEKIQEIHFTL